MHLCRPQKEGRSNTQEHTETHQRRTGAHGNSQELSITHMKTYIPGSLKNTYENIHSHIDRYTYTYVYMYMCIQRKRKLNKKIYIYIHMHIYMHIYIYIIIFVFVIFVVLILFCTATILGCKDLGVGSDFQLKGNVRTTIKLPGRGGGFSIDLEL